ncbi:penicillin acylase family protein [Aeromicrobium wangtongii]|uniref:Penicillin acylase family protein n=1 Tax=Aeromicrobium wangtongii TaxID=2969247 RepID=A0ABY5MB07_9ACTN|nr:penicillin acylase family protein [Aeromicrobium wangtongii]MCD9196817.1 penicillin acylase family protein [Aeromicrobium wangtongii]UUP14326.1 penicillin acylase family protein [Aeromicrobium wangtongii]
MLRIGRIIAALLGLVLIGIAVFSFITVRRSFPDTTGEVQIAGLGGEVTVKRDGKGIPQIYADTPEDLFLAQGYVHAQDRFYEMDFRRHVTAGRLAELVGDAALETDKFVRTLGWRRVAEKELALLDDDTRRLVNAYARGVNRYIEDRSAAQLSLEYAVLGLTGPSYRPQRWTAVDSLAWIKAMAWDLRSNMNDEISRVLSTADLGVDEVEELYPDYPSAHAPIVTQKGTVEAGRFVQAPDAAGLARSAVASLKAAKSGADALPALLGTGDGIGSNSWVVGGDMTSTGKPILANDPHLAPSMPGIWYQVGLHCRTVDEACPYDVAGFSFSGLPGVVVGHNASIAWGVTTMYADVADLYLEKVTGDSYEYDGQQIPLETRQESFEVAGGQTETITVRSTRHGPILSDLDEDAADVGRSEQKNAEAGSYEVALRWTALDPQPTIKAVFALGRAQDWEQFRAAAKLFTVPSQNLVYADVKGNIGYQSPGTIPVRRTGDGRWPVPGWDSRYEWDGSLPFDSLPTVLNPDEGSIVTANNQVIGDEYPAVLGADTAPGYRSQRIRELLEGRDDLTVDDMSTIQNDTYNANAARLVPALLDVDMGKGYYRQGQATLEKWDLHQDADSPGAAYFNVVWKNLLARTFHDELPKSQWPGGGERWFSVIDSILDRPGNHWWDDTTTPDVRESRDEVLAAAMRDARDELTMIQSRNPRDWRWGTMHTLELVNPTLGDSGVGLVDKLFNRGPIKVGGGSGIVNATGWDATEGYKVTAVPSMRMIVDLDDLDRSRWIQITGASGHAFHDHYNDQTELWADGRTLPWAFRAKAVDAATDDTLTLKPSGSS